MTQIITQSEEVLVIDGTGTEILLVEETEVVMLEATEQGPAGPAAFVSANPDNRLRLGTDAGLYVPDDLTPDPLAYYILAKA